MLVRKLRLRKGWSQDQLAELADVSVRTIQRIERGHAMSLETANALAAVFEVDVTTFTTEPDDMKPTDNRPTQSHHDHDINQEHLAPDEAEALEYAKGIKDFYSGVLCLVVVAAVFFPAFGFDEPLLYIIFGGITAGLAIQGLVAFEIIRMPFQNLEKRIAEKKLGRKL